MKSKNIKGSGPDSRITSTKYNKMEKSLNILYHLHIKYLVLNIMIILNIFR